MIIWICELTRPDEAISSRFLARFVLCDVSSRPDYDAPVDFGGVDSMIFVLSLHRNRFIDYTQFLEIHILSVQITVSYTRYFDLIPTLDLAKAY